MTDVGYVLWRGFCSILVGAGLALLYAAAAWGL